MSQNVIEWFQVKSTEDFPKLQEKLRAIDPYDAYTKGKRDKNDRPICFLGTMARGQHRVEGHFAVWFKSSELEAQGMNIIEQLVTRATA